MCGECKSQRCYGNCHPLLSLLFSEKFLCEHGAGASPAYRMLVCRGHCMSSDPGRGCRVCSQGKVGPDAALAWAVSLEESG